MFGVSKEAALSFGLVLNVSYFVTVERNVATIVKLLSELRRSGKQSIEVKPEEFAAYNAAMDKKFSQYSWGASDCHSYYTNQSGHASFLFPGTFAEYKKMHEGMGLGEYSVT